MKNPFRNKRLDPNMVKAVWEAPATHNRKTRRSVGLLGRYWRWDVRGTDMERTFVPRYIRRHAALYGITPTNRRQRKAQARIQRAMAAAGIRA